MITTQINIAGHPGNDVDHVVREGIGIFDRELLMAEFKPLPGSKIGELAANFEIVIGQTPDDRARPARANATR